MRLSNFLKMRPVMEGIRPLEVRRAEELAEKVMSGEERIDAVMVDGLR